MKNPLVSVISPAYKSQATIKRAILSVIEQDFQDWEMIIISDDLQDYSHIIQDDRLVFTTTNKSGSGASNARNQGLKIARGQYITVLDADDRFNPGRLAKMIPLVQEFGAAITEIEIRDHQLDLVMKKYNQSPKERFLDPSNIIWNCIHTCNVYMYDRERIPDLYYDEDLLVMEDTVFLLSFFNNIELIGYESTPLQIYYKRRDSLCNSPQTAKTFHKTRQQILEKIESRKISIKNPHALNELLKLIKCALDIDKKYNGAIITEEIFHQELNINRMKYFDSH